MLIGLTISLANTGRLRALELAGQTVAASALPPGAAPASLSFLAPRPTGEILRVALAGRGPLRLAVTSRSLGLPPGTALPPLPATMVPAPGYNSFTTQVRREFSF